MLYHSQIMDRTTELRAFGGTTESLVDKLLGHELFLRSIKGMNPYKLDQHIMKLSEQLFRTEKAIVTTAPRSEWGIDNKLIGLFAALDLQKRAISVGFSVTLKPNYVIFSRNGVTIESYYDYDSLEELAQLIGFYEQALFSHN